MNLQQALDDAVWDAFALNKQAITKIGKTKRRGVKRTVFVNAHEGLVFKVSNLPKECWTRAHPFSEALTSNPEFAGIKLCYRKHGPTEQANGFTVVFQSGISWPLILSYDVENPSLYKAWLGHIHFLKGQSPSSFELAVVTAWLRELEKAADQLRACHVVPESERKTKWQITFHLTVGGHSSEVAMTTGAEFTENEAVQYLKDVLGVETDEALNIHCKDIEFTRIETKQKGASEKPESNQGSVATPKGV